MEYQKKREERQEGRQAGIWCIVSYRSYHIGPFRMVVLITMADGTGAAIFLTVQYHEWNDNPPQTGG